MLFQSCSQRRDPNGIRTHFEGFAIRPQTCVTLRVRGEKANRFNRFRDFDRDDRFGRFNRFNNFIVFDNFGFPFFPSYYPYPYYPHPYGDYYSYGYGGYGYQGGYGNGSSVVQLQRRLARAGYYHGAIDGIMGPATRRAIRAYEGTHNQRNMTDRY
jgi:Putative peptidoglycan binding domain